jgi:hypothetical protein
MEFFSLHYFFHSVLLHLVFSTRNASKWQDQEAFRQQEGHTPGRFKMSVWFLRPFLHSQLQMRLAQFGAFTLHCARPKTEGAFDHFASVHPQATLS